MMTTQGSNDFMLPGMPIESLKVLQMFKVPISKLKALTSVDAKVDFLIDHMSGHIKDQLRQLKQMENQRQQNIKTF
jgi:hypothetical protein